MNTYGFSSGFIPEIKHTFRILIFGKSMNVLLFKFVSLLNFIIQTDFHLFHFMEMNLGQRELLKTFEPKTTFNQKLHIMHLHILLVETWLSQSYRSL